jgi:hypothetical protein
MEALEYNMQRGLTQMGMSLFTDLRKSLSSTHEYRTGQINENHTMSDYEKYTAHSRNDNQLIINYCIVLGLLIVAVGVSKALK